MTKRFLLCKARYEQFKQGLEDRANADGVGQDESGLRKKSAELLGGNIDAALGEMARAEDEDQGQLWFEMSVPRDFKSALKHLRNVEYFNGTLIQKTIIENILAEWEEFVKEKAIPFCEAVTLLSGKLNTPKETIEHELAGWASDGDLKAYASRTLAESKEFNATYIDKYGEYLEKSKGIGFEYLPLMQGLYFRQSDLETFQPKDRYITGADLIKRWIGRLGSREGVINKVETLANDSQILAFHPFNFSMYPKIPKLKRDVPFEMHLFFLEHVENIEREEFGEIDGEVKQANGFTPHKAESQYLKLGYVRACLKCAFSELEQLAIDGLVQWTVYLDDEDILRTQKFSRKSFKTYQGLPQELKPPENFFYLNNEDIREMDHHPNEVIATEVWYGDKRYDLEGKRRFIVDMEIFMTTADMQKAKQYIHPKESQAYRTPGFSLAATPEDYDEALLQDAWEVWEALCWLHGENPLYYHGDIERDYSRLVEKFIKPAIRAGKLTPQATSPYDWIQWALSKGIPIPERLRLFVDDQSCLAQQTPNEAVANSQHPIRYYPQAFGHNVSVAKLREKWGLSDNKYLDEAAGMGELVPFDNSRMPVEVKIKGLGYQFGIHHDIEWSDGGSTVWDDTNITWMDTLPDDVVYELPEVLAYENLYPALKHNAKASQEPKHPVDSARLDNVDSTPVATGQPLPPWEHPELKKHFFRVTSFTQGMIKRAWELEESELLPVWQSLVVKPPNGYRVEQERADSKPIFFEIGINDGGIKWNAAQKAWTRARDKGLLPVSKPD